MRLPHGCVNQTHPKSANWTINLLAIYLSSSDSEAVCFCLSVHSECPSAEKDKELEQNFSFLVLHHLPVCTIQKYFMKCLVGTCTLHFFLPVLISCHKSKLGQTSPSSHLPCWIKSLKLFFFLFFFRAPPSASWPSYTLLIIPGNPKGLKPMWILNCSNIDG